MMNSNLLFQNMIWGTRQEMLINSQKPIEISLQSIGDTIRQLFAKIKNLIPFENILKHSPVKG